MLRHGAVAFVPFGSAGPCLSGATRLRGTAYQSLISYPNIFSNISSPVHQFPLTNQQLINQLVINLLFAGLQFSHLVIGGLLDSWCRAPGQPIYLPPARVLNLGWTLKFIKISNNLQYSKNHQIGAPRLPKVSKMRSKQVPEIIKFMKKSKK